MTATETETWNYPWVHLTDTGFVCDRCGRTHAMADRSLTRSDLRREVYDFLVRHKHCQIPVVQ